MSGGYGAISDLGALVIWIIKGYRMPFREIRYGNYPCFELGFVLIVVVIALVFYVPSLFDI